MQLFIITRNITWDISCCGFYSRSSCQRVFFANYFWTVSYMVGWEFDAVIDLFCIVNTTAESTALMCVRGINSLSLSPFSLGRVSHGQKIRSPFPKIQGYQRSSLLTSECACQNTGLEASLADVLTFLHFCSWDLRTQKLKSHLLRTQSL